MVVDKKTIVYLLRHGEVELDNKGKSLDKDSSLNDNGIKQAKNIANQFSSSREKIDLMFTSKKKRAVQTSEIIGQKTGLISNSFDDFNEYSLPFYHLNVLSIFNINFYKNYFLYRKSINSFNKIIKENEGKTLLFVIHGNVMRQIIGNKLGLSFKNRARLSHNNAHITRMTFFGTKLKSLNYSNSPLIF